MSDEMIVSNLALQENKLGEALKMLQHAEDCGVGVSGPDHACTCGMYAVRCKITEARNYNVALAAQVKHRDVPPGTPVLCYVRLQWAYFTTQPLSEQTGDDWNDVPYEHNAGTPYRADRSNQPLEWEIIQVAFDGPFEEPYSGESNSRWSVDMINLGATPWLKTMPYGVEPKIKIFAGTPLEKFCELVELGGGKVYLQKVKTI